MRTKVLATVVAVVPLLICATAAPGRKVMVICAPGYPGTTEQAQPTLDAFAAAVARGAGLPQGRLGTVYFETEQGGLARLAMPDAALALVRYPFFVEHGAGLSLTPRLAIVEESGSTEIWSLVARRGLVSSPASLDGWELTGMPGYAPTFVAGPLLGAWGTLPATARITFTPAVLSPLRRAAKGEKLAVLLDPTQAASLATLPFAGDLEVLFRSKPLPGGILCTVGDRLSASEAKALSRALLHLHESDDAKPILATMRIKRFEPVDPSSFESARHKGAGAPAGDPPGVPRSSFPKGSAWQARARVSAVDAAVHER